MTNEEMATKYLQWVGDNLEKLKSKFKAYCNHNLIKFDEDLLNETYLKIHDLIANKGLEDSTEKGFENYTFISYKQNIKRETQYSRNAKRDCNVTSDAVDELYEEWYNNTNDTARIKIFNDLFKDFATLYILHKVDDNFDEEHFNLFRLKFLSNHMSYKELSRRTRVKKVRQKVLEVKQYLKDNLTKDEVEDAFLRKYGELYDN